jgi:hypothetical protein
MCGLQNYYSGQKDGRFPLRLLNCRAVAALLLKGFHRFNDHGKYIEGGINNNNNNNNNNNLHTHFGKY